MRSLALPFICGLLAYAASCCTADEGTAGAESSVDIVISLPAQGSDESIVIRAKDGVSYRVVMAVLKAVTAGDGEGVQLSILAKNAKLARPTSTGEQLAGIRLSTDPVELYVTDRLPAQVTRRLCEALLEATATEDVVLKSTHSSEATAIPAAPRLLPPPSLGSDPFGN